MTTGNSVKIQLVRSGIRFDRTQKETLLGLGLRKRHQIVERPDNPATRGMIDKVRHLVRILADRAGSAGERPLGGERKVAWRGVIVVPGTSTQPKKKAAKQTVAKKKKPKGARKPQKGRK